MLLKQKKTQRQFADEVGISNVALNHLISGLKVYAGFHNIVYTCDRDGKVDPPVQKFILPFENKAFDIDLDWKLDFTTLSV